MTKFEVTLKQLRDNDACVSGYNKVVSVLKGIEFDRDRKTYIRFKHEEPISLISILETNGIDDAIWCLRCNSKWDRDSRLFAVWCARQVKHLMKDERINKALDVAEQFANGLATKEELNAASEAASDAASDSARAAWAAWAAASDSARAARAAAWAASEAASESAWAASESVAAWAASEAASEAAASESAWAASESVAASEAAWAASESAARAAALSAGVAASDAAWAASEAASEAAASEAAWAARDAARVAQKEMFVKMCNGEAPWQVEQP